MPWTIQTLDFLTVDRDFEDAQPVDQPLIRPMADGTAFLLEAFRTETQIFHVSTTVANFDEYVALKRSVRDLLFSVAIVTDQHGEEWTVFVRRAVVHKSMNVTGDYDVMVIWSLHPKSERPEIAADDAG